MVRAAIQLLPSPRNLPGRLPGFQRSGGQARRAARLVIPLTTRAAGCGQIRCQCGDIAWVIGRRGRQQRSCPAEARRARRWAGRRGKTDISPSEACSRALALHAPSQPAARGSRDLSPSGTVASRRALACTSGRSITASTRLARLPGVTCPGAWQLDYGPGGQDQQVEDPHLGEPVTAPGELLPDRAPPPGYGPGRVRDGSGGAEAGAGMRRTWTQTASVAATGRRTGRTWPRVTATA